MCTFADEGSCIPINRRQIVPAIHNLSPKRHKIVPSTVRKTRKMVPEYLGASAALPTSTRQRPPCKGNLSPTTTDKLERKLALVIAVAALQEAPSIPTSARTKMKQDESTVDQLSDRPLEGIPTHRDHTVIVSVLMRDAHTQIEVGLPALSPGWNPLIVEQGLEQGEFDQIPVAIDPMEALIHSSTAVMPNYTCTTTYSEKNIVIKPAETS